MEQWWNDNQQGKIEENGRKTCSLSILPITNVTQSPGAELENSTQP
jgi:hypothetical protein